MKILQAYEIVDSKKLLVAIGTIGGVLLHYSHFDNNNNNNFITEDKDVFLELDSNHEKSKVIALVISSCGSYIIAAFANKSVGCWDFKTHQLISTTVYKKRPTAIAFARFE